MIVASDPRQPIIFLDVDGVIVVKHAVKQARPLGIRANGLSYRRPARHVGFARTFAIDAVHAVNSLLMRTGAALVMSSSWRSKPDARGLIAAGGVIQQWHDDWATDQLGGLRGDQVTRWLDAHGQPPHVILDDWLDELTEHRPRVVAVPFRTGFTMEHADEAAAILALQGCTHSRAGEAVSGTAWEVAASERASTSPSTPRPSTPIPAAP